MISVLVTTYERITCGAALFSSVSVESEVFFCDVVRYSCAVTGLVDGSSFCETRCESSGDLDYLAPGAETCEPVPCSNISSTDAPHTTFSSGPLVYNETAVVTCYAGYSTDRSNYLASSYYLTCGGDGSLTGLDTTCTVQVPVPEIPRTASQEKNHVR